MSLVLLKPNRLGTTEFGYLSIDPHPNKPFALDFFDDIPEFARLILNQWREYYDLRLRFAGQYLIDNLLRRLPVKRPTRERIVRLADC